MLPDFHVVTNLYQVIDLGPLAYDRFPQRSAVDRRAGSDFDVVLDPHDSNLRNFVVLALIQGEAVTVRANDNARMDDAATANPRPIVDDHIRINDAFVTDARSGLDRDSLKDGDVVSEHDILAYRRERPHRHIRSELGAGSDAGFRRHAFRQRPSGKPASHDFRQRKVGIIDAYPAF